MGRRFWKPFFSTIVAGCLPGLAVRAQGPDSSSSGLQPPAGSSTAAARSGAAGSDNSPRTGQAVDEDELPWNWELSTLGGLQFWTDLQHRGGWRLQRHCTSGHCRLVDAGNVRRAWGTREQCEREFERLIGTGVVPPNRPTVVILAHGLARTRGCWKPMSEHLSRHTDWQVIDFSYASTRLPMADHAAALHSVIESLGPEVRTIHCVGHSMGNIVFRHFLNDHRDPVTGRQGDPRIGRIVMIAPPNQGSKVARWLQPTGVFSLVTGRSGVELGRDWAQLENRLATPEVEFGIIAGGNPETGKGLNPLFKGGDDLTVSVEETRLPGARDMLVRPWLHPTIMRQPEVCDATLRFLLTGCFSGDGICHPVPALPASNPAGSGGPVQRPGDADQREQL